MKRSMTYKSMIGACGLVLLFSYQNCSKIGTGLAIQDKATGVNQTGNGDGSTPIITVGHDEGGAASDPGTTTGGNTDTSGGGTSPIGHAGGGGGLITPTPLPTETCIDRPTTDAAKKDQTAALALAVIEGLTVKYCDDIKNHTDPIKTGTDTAGSGPTTNTETKHNGQPPPKDSITNTSTVTTTLPKVPTSAEIALAVKFCEDAKHMRAVSQFKIDRVNGDWVAVANHVIIADRIEGSLLLAAATPQSTAGVIDRITANNDKNLALVLCGFDNVIKVDRITGNIIAVDTVIKNVDRVVGNIVLVNSAIEKIDRFTDGAKVLNLAK